MNKIIDRNGRLFGKVSIIDLVVVLVVAALAMALNMKSNDLDASKTTGADTPITFTVLAENVDLYIADAIRVGDSVYDKDRASGGAVGKITAIEVLPGETTAETTYGAFIRAGNENSRNLLVTIQGVGMVTNGRYSINRIYEIGVNASRNFYTSYSGFTGSVIEIG